MLNCPFQRPDPMTQIPNQSPGIHDLVAVMCQRQACCLSDSSRSKDWVLQMGSTQTGCIRIPGRKCKRDSALPGWLPPENPLEPLLYHSTPAFNREGPFTIIKLWSFLWHSGIYVRAKAKSLCFRWRWWNTMTMAKAASKRGPGFWSVCLRLTPLRSRLSLTVLPPRLPMHRSASHWPTSHSCCVPYKYAWKSEWGKGKDEAMD